MQNSNTQNNMIDNIDWGARQKQKRQYKGNQVDWPKQQNQNGQNQNGGGSGNSSGGNQPAQNQSTQFLPPSVQYPPNYGGSPYGNHYPPNYGGGPSGNHYPPNYGNGPANGRYPASNGNTVPENNGLAIAGLVLGLLSVLIPFLGLLTAIPGLIISISGLKPPNKGMATAGLILSVLAIVGYLFAIALGALSLGAVGGIFSGFSRRPPLPF